MTISIQQESLSKALSFLQELESHRIAYELDHVRDALMVKVAIPGERWEVEFFADGNVEIERFISTGDLYNEEWITKLFAAYSD